MRFVSDRRSGLLIPDMGKRQRGFVTCGPALFGRGRSAPDPTLRGTFAKWNLEGNPDDTSGNGHDLSPSNTPVYGGASLLPSGDGTSCDLAPNNAFFSIPSGFITELTPPFSIVTFALISNLALGNSHQIFCSATGGINWYVNTSAAMVVGIAGVANKATDARTLSLNTNYMLGITCSSSGDIKFYVNKTASSVFSGALSSSNTGTDVTRIGDYSGDPSASIFYGRLQRYALCNVELSGIEISTFYDALS
jgi:hypothetical protein